MNTAQLKAWIPLIGLTCAAFVFNTSEFIPIGLLTDIAQDFEISESKAGLLITVYAWVVALTSLPLMLLASRIEFRKLLLSIVGLFIVSHLFSAASSSYGMLMVSRIGVACAHAIFWSITPPLAVRIAPEGRKSAALSIIMAGTSVAMVIGLPLGRIIGLHTGWRTTFFCIAAVTFLIFLLLLFIFPRVPVRNKTFFKKNMRFLRQKNLMVIYVTTAILVTGHYTGYSYIEPFLGQVARMSDGMVTLSLIIFGLVGMLGSFLFAKYYPTRSLQLIKGSVILITLMLLWMRFSAYNVYTAVLMCAFWGTAIVVYNLAFQAKIIEYAPQETAVAMSVYSGIFNLGIGTGALVGSLVCSSLSLHFIGYAGGLIALAATVYCFQTALPVFKNATHTIF